VDELTLKPLPSPLAAQQVKQQVEAVCGRRGRDIRVIAQPDSGWDISLKAASAEDAQRMWTEIQAMSELAPYRVSLKVQVEP
jgi:hypothetical protein